ncbi:MAG: helix-turn-helix transcriptional regulator [Desulfobacterales bacterium]|nr:helix-turn-helix transcriptional regulator [Desulfobacterales bacterium]
MPYISLTKLDANDSPDSGEPVQTPDQIKRKKVFRHPVRDRILSILRDGEPKTQREIGKILYMSNAAVHYHIKLLIDIGFIKLHNTRLGPNGITEKLYTIALENWPEVGNADMAYYLDYIISWITERNREGLSILKTNEVEVPLFIGSYTASASLKDLLKFKRDAERLFNRYLKKNEKQMTNENTNDITFSVTFSILPTKDANHDNSVNVLEFEPKI